MSAEDQIRQFAERIVRLREEAGDTDSNRRRDGGRRTPPGVIDAAMEMLKAGGTVTEAALLCGVGQSSLSQTAKRRGIVFPNSNAAVRAAIAERAKVTQAYIDGVKVTPSAEWLRAAFDYDANTGALIWRRRDDVPESWNVRYIGKFAGTAHSAGYLSVRIFKRSFLAHRLIWKLVHGYDPRTIDHRNGDRRDNRAANLRDATHQQNCWNTVARSKTGIKGVRKTPSGTYEARIGCRHIGNFPSADQACAAYMDAALAERGSFEGVMR